MWPICANHLESLSRNPMTLNPRSGHETLVSSAESLCRSKSPIIPEESSGLLAKRDKPHEEAKCAPRSLLRSKRERTRDGPHPSPRLGSCGGFPKIRRPFFWNKDNHYLLGSITDYGNYHSLGFLKPNFRL